MNKQSMALELLKGLQDLPIEEGPLSTDDSDLGKKIIYWEETFLVLINKDPLEEEERLCINSNLNSEFVARFIKDNYLGYETLDPYGGCLFTHKSRLYKLLNTYGDEDSYCIELALCIALIQEPNYIEALDCKIEGGRLVPYKLRGKVIPKGLRHKDLGVGKRGYYLDRETGEVSLKANIKAYHKAPEEYRHGGSDEFVSSPRVKFLLSLLCKDLES